MNAHYHRYIIHFVIAYWVCMVVWITAKIQWFLSWPMYHLFSNFCENRSSSFFGNPANKQTVTIVADC